MKFSEFKQACTNILNQVGPNAFGSVKLRLHDVDKSSQFAQVMSDAGPVTVYPNGMDIARSRTPRTLASVLSTIAEIAEREGGDPEISVVGDAKFVFGYDRLQNAAIASYDLPCDDDINESVLDSPTNGLDPSVWRNGSDGKPELTGEAESVVAAVMKWAFEHGMPEGVGVHIVGSITSNQYSEDSDVDLHFYGNEIEAIDDIDGFNTGFRTAFKNFAEKRPEFSKIGSHKIEVYAQRNEFQDLMSVGCYDVKAGQWKSGPQMTDASFDPYSEYYKDAVEYAGEAAERAKSAAMNAYEGAMALTSSSDPEFRRNAGIALMAVARDAKAALDGLRELRNAVAQPHSEEEALRLRNDRAKLVADFAYKLMWRFGYSAICAECERALMTGQAPDRLASAILTAVSETAAKNAKTTAVLAENEPVGGIPGTVRSSVESGMKAFVERVMKDAGMDAEITEVWLHGSRMRGGWRDDSDLDAVVFYTGPEREDDMFNALNCGDEKYDVRGIPVDFNPIRVSGQADIDAYKARSAEYDAEVLNEGFGKTMRSAALAALTAAAGIGTAAVKYAQTPAAAVQSAEQKYAGLSRSNMTNLLATISYNEAMIDWIRTKDDDSIIAILNTIDNRAGGDPEHYADEISAKSQFFSARFVKGGYVDAKYQKFDPEEQAKAEGGRLGRSQKECWKKCLDLADDLLSGTLPNVIGDRNMIANKKKDNAKAWNAWGKSCDLVIGNHSFGYEKAHDGYIKYKKTKPVGLDHGENANAKTNADDSKTSGNKPAKPGITYTVKAGDTLGAIAAAHRTTVAAIAAKNGLSNPNMIRIGQKLKI